MLRQKIKGNLKPIGDEVYENIKNEFLDLKQ